MFCCLDFKSVFKFKDKFLKLKKKKVFKNLFLEIGKKKFKCLYGKYENHK